MKIIATQGGSRYLVEITDDEMAKAAGFGGSHYTEWQNATRSARDGSHSGASFKIGVVIDVNVAHRHVGSLIEREAEVKKSATVLRALADLIERGVQGIVVPPQEAKS